MQYLGLEYTSKGKMQESKTIISCEGDKKKGKRGKLGTPFGLSTYNWHWHLESGLLR
jgi:hypothetical protein